jgi:hypothetical protein
MEVAADDAAGAGARGGIAATKTFGDAVGAGGGAMRDEVGVATGGGGGDGETTVLSRGVGDLVAVSFRGSSTSFTTP